MAGGGYNAGSIYVDLQVKIGNSSKEIERLEKQIQSLGKQERNLAINKRALQQALEEAKVQYGENSTQAEKLSRKLENLGMRESELRNRIIATRQALQEESRQINTVSGMFRQMGDDMVAPVSSADKLTHSLNALKAVIASVAVQRLYDALIVPNAELESNIASFEVLLGSYEKATNLTNQLIATAAKTPLTSPDLISGAQDLLAVGVEMEDINKTLRMLGDLSMGSSEKLQRLINAFGKIQTSGKGSLEYLNYFSEASVPIIKALSDTLGVTTEEFFKLSKAGQVTAAQVNEALFSMTEEGGKFYGMMEKQSQTFSGLSSTLKDNLGMIGVDIGNEAFAQLKGYLQDIIDEIERLKTSGELDKIVTKWGGAIADTIKNVGNFVEFLYKIRDVIGGVISAFAGYKAVELFARALKMLGVSGATALGPLALVAAAVGVVVNSLSNIKSEVDSSLASYSNLIDENNRLADSYRKSFETINDNKSKADDYLSTLETLTSKEKLNNEEKAKMNEAVNNLNSIYPELNLQYNEETNALNRSVQAMRDYIDLTSTRAKIKINFEVITGLDSQIASLKANNEALQKEANQIIETVEAEGRAQTIEEGVRLQKISNLYKEGENQIQAYTKTREEYAKKQEEYGKALEESSEKEAEALEALKTPMEVVGTEIEALNQSMESNEEAFESLSKTTNDYVSDISELTELIVKEGKQISLTKDETLKLLKTYPELANKIKTTSDGYSIEKDIINELMETKKAEGIAAINSEVDKSRQTLLSSQERLSAYASEIEMIGSLAEAQNVLVGLKGISSMLDTSAGGQAFGWVEGIEGVTKLTEDELKTQKENIAAGIKGIKDAIIPGYERLDKITKEANDRIAAMNLSASKIGAGGKSKGGESAVDKSIRNLKYQLDMEYITQKQYYDSLEILKNKYYAKGTKEWQSYTLEITKGRKKMEEEMKKAELSVYEDRLSNSYAWIEQEKFYSRISNDEQIAGYERMKAYTKEFYTSGKIDYKKYVDSIKKLDKEIYTVQKNNLKTSNEELSELRQKRYDEAVKQIEDYYDALNKAEEEAERQKQLSELQSQLELYQGAVTRAGQEKYKEIEESIEDIKKEGEKAAREVEKESKLEELEKTYKSLEETQNTYFDSVLTYSEDVTKKIQEMTKMVNDAFGNVGNILSGINNSTTNNNSSYSTTVNQTNHISNPESGRAVVKMTDILYRYPVK